jgi:hypothetical protein
VGVLDRARLLPDLAQVQLAVATTRRAAQSLYASFGFNGFGIERQALKINWGTSMRSTWSCFFD